MTWTLCGHNNAHDSLYTTDANYYVVYHRVGHTHIWLVLYLLPPVTLCHL